MCFFLTSSSQVSKFTVTCPATVGKLLLIEVDKRRVLLLPEDAWFLSKVRVKSPEGDVYNFPVYHWLTDSKVQVFREGTGLRPSLATVNSQTSGPWVLEVLRNY